MSSFTSAPQQHEVMTMAVRPASRQRGECGDSLPAGNGLSPADEKTLRDILQKADAVEHYRPLMGGKERTDLDSLVQDVQLRLEPKAVPSLRKRADAFFGAIKQRDWGARALGDNA